MTLADDFCSLACLRYDETDAPPRWAEAAQLLEATPELVDHHVWAAAAAMDTAALRRALDREPALADRTGGPCGWPPLLYLTYSRVPLERSESEVLAAATVLLDAGADPNAGFLWRGLTPPFTALTGVLGEGEQGARRQPPHSHSPALARLLLDRGAHPRDHQALYNRMFRSENTHLELLFDHGLTTADPSPWEVRLGDAMENQTQLWARQIRWAAEHGFEERLELLARNGIEVSGVTMTPSTFPTDVDAVDADGQTALHQAAWDGDPDRIRRLLAAGADPSITDGRFHATALGFAEYAYQTEAAQLIRDLTAHRTG